MDPNNNEETLSYKLANYLEDPELAGNFRDLEKEFILTCSDSLEKEYFNLIKVFRNSKLGTNYSLVQKIKLKAEYYNKLNKFKSKLNPTQKGLFNNVMKSARKLVEERKSFGLSGIESLILYLIKS